MTTERTERTDPVKLPISEVVDLARQFTADEWLHASRIAADHGVSEVCRAVYRFRLADPA